MRSGDRKSRIVAEYEAFSKFKGVGRKRTQKAFNKRQRRATFVTARQYFIQSIVMRAISRWINRDPLKNDERKNNSQLIIGNTFVAIFDATLSELRDSESCEFCGREFALFGLKR